MNETRDMSRPIESEPENLFVIYLLQDGGSHFDGQNVVLYPGVPVRAGSLDPDFLTQLLSEGIVAYVEHLAQPHRGKQVSPCAAELDVPSARQSEPTGTFCSGVPPVFTPEIPALETPAPEG